ncbi:MAG TPA: hypothetical protein VJC03_08200 [bacterium]|nr:hypothetical protein [bacterium]
MLLLLGVLFFFLSPLRAEFQDIPQENKEIVNKFSEDALFSKFVYKFGKEAFRPEGSVTRGDLLFVLNEYLVLFHGLRKDIQQISAQISRMKTALPAPPSGTGVSSDEVVNEVMKQLGNPQFFDVLLQNSKAFRGLQLKKAEEELNEASVELRGGSAADEELVALRRVVRKHEEELLKLQKEREIARKERPAGKKDRLLDQPSASGVENEIEVLYNKINNLEAQVKQSERFEGRRDSGAELKNGILSYVKFSLGLSMAAFFFAAR